MSTLGEHAVTIVETADPRNLGRVATNRGLELAAAIESGTGLPLTSYEYYETPTGGERVVAFFLGLALGLFTGTTYDCCADIGKALITGTHNEPS